MKAGLLGIGDLRPFRLELEAQIADELHDTRRIAVLSGLDPEQTVRKRRPHGRAVTDLPRQRRLPEAGRATNRNHRRTRRHRAAIAAQQQAEQTPLLVGTLDQRRRQVGNQGQILRAGRARRSVLSVGGVALLELALDQAIQQPRPAMLPDTTPDRPWSRRVARRPEPFSGDALTLVS